VDESVKSFSENISIRSDGYLHSIYILFTNFLAHMKQYLDYGKLTEILFFVSRTSKISTSARITIRLLRENNSVLNVIPASICCSRVGNLSVSKETRTAS
jgi:hypothetical protein